MRKPEMSAGLKMMLEGLTLAAVVQIKAFHLYEVSENEKEIQVECSGLDWASNFPLGLYFHGVYSDDEIENMRTLYTPGRILRVEGSYSVLLPEDGGITLYDSTASVVSDEDVAWLKAASRSISNL